jgi:hypothetical protein
MHLPVGTDGLCPRPKATVPVGARVGARLVRRVGGRVGQPVVA